MKCPNCGRDEPWNDASFCPRCGKQLISIIPNATIDNRDDKKIRLQIYQIGVWAFLTTAGFLYVSGTVKPDQPLYITAFVLACSGILAVFVIVSLGGKYLPEKPKK